MKKNLKKKKKNDTILNILTNKANKEVKMLEKQTKFSLRGIKNLLIGIALVFGLSAEVFATNWTDTVEPGRYFGSLHVIYAGMPGTGDLARFNNASHLTPQVCVKVEKARGNKNQKLRFAVLGYDSEEDSYSVEYRGTGYFNKVVGPGLDENNRCVRDNSCGLSYQKRGIEINDTGGTGQYTSLYVKVNRNNLQAKTYIYKAKCPFKMDW